MSSNLVRDYQGDEMTYRHLAELLDLAVRTVPDDKQGLIYLQNQIDEASQLCRLPTDSVIVGNEGFSLLLARHGCLKA